MASSITQTMRPIGPGSYPDPYLTNPDRGFFHYPEAPFWENIVNECYVQDNEALGGYNSWAVNNEGFTYVSVDLPAFEGEGSATINWVKVYAQVTSGIDQTTGEAIDPSGTGNWFYIGIRTGSPANDYWSDALWCGTSDLTVMSTTFTEKSVGVPWTPDDLVNLEWALKYDRYWTTSDKGYTINDNGHNSVGQGWVEVNYTPQTAAGGAGMLLM